MALVLFTAVNAVYGCRVRVPCTGAGDGQVQVMARDFLNDYLFIKVGRVGSAYGNSAATAMTGMSPGIRRLTWESASQRGKP